MLTLRVLGQVPDELDIDLDEFDLQAFEVGQATVAGSEVVEGEAQTEPGQLAHERLGERLVGGDRGFRDLAHEQRRGRRRSRTAGA